MHVGTFGAPVGLKGEIRINCLTKTIQVFNNFQPSEGRGRIHQIKRYKKIFR